MAGRSNRGSNRDPDVRRVRVRVRGRVQGVFFRASCAREARRLGVFGSVRNVPGGDVEAVFEGDPAAVGSMLAWCEVGPPSAQVVKVESREEPPVGDDRFHVLP